MDVNGTYYANANEKQTQDSVLIDGTMNLDENDVI
jgi:hypothetical protein